MSASVSGDPRQRVCEIARRMVTDGLVVGTSGNLSVRDGDRLLVTPSGVDYAAMGPSDVVTVDAADGRILRGDLRPTSELPLHLAVHHVAGGGGTSGGGGAAGGDGGAVGSTGDPGTAVRTAVVHTHSPAAVAVSLLRDEVPRVHYQLAMFGGTVPVVDYVPYGTDELAEATRVALRDTTPGRCRAVVLRHHGTVVLGPDLGVAYDGARQLEWLCDVWLRARGAGADPAELTADQVAEIVPRFASYGQA